jgi:hypothetical protein
MPPLSPQQRREARSAQLRADMEQVIAEGRMTVRQMTPEERVVSDARRETIQATQAKKRKRW